MPVLFKKIRKRKNTKKQTTEKTSWDTENILENDFPQFRYADHNPCLPLITNPHDKHGGVKEENKVPKKKAFEKFKNFIRRGKQKKCKECKQAGKWSCSCNFDTMDRKFCDLFGETSGNLNHSALDPRLRGGTTPRMRSSSSLLMNKDHDDKEFESVDYKNCVHDIQKFCKYVPVKKMWGPHYPKSLMEDFKMVWLDMQLWYSAFYEQKTRNKTRDDLNSSKSDTCLAGSPSRASFLSENDDVEAEAETVNRKRDERQKEALHGQRFGVLQNRIFLKTLTSGDLSFSSDCRLQLYVCRRNASCLIHIKTEMFVEFMKYFCRRDHRFETLWVDDMSKNLPNSMDVKTCGLMNPEVALEICSQLKRAKAVLYVSETASILLRHHGTGFLETMATMAGVKRDEFVILPLNLNPAERALSVSQFEDPLSPNQSDEKSNSNTSNVSSNVEYITSNTKTDTGAKNESETPPRPHL